MILYYFNAIIISTQKQRPIMTAQNLGDFMKSIIAIALATLSLNSFAACDLTLGVKKENAKSAKLAGVSFSTKQIEALKGICNVTLKPMSTEELVNDFRASLEKKAAKAAAKAAAAE